MPTEFPTADQLPPTDACVNVNRNSQIFRNKRNWPNSAPMLVSQRILRKDNSSLHMMMIHFTSWWDHVESILSLEVMNHPRRKGGSAETRRSVQSWTWRSVTIKGRWRCGVQDRILISWHICFFCSDRVRNQQIRNRNVRRDSCCKCWGQKYRETCCEGWTKTDIKFDVVSCVYSLSWAKMDRHWTRAVRFDDPAEFFKSRFAGTSHWSIEAWDQLPGKRRRAKEKVSVLLEPQLIWTFPAFQSNSRNIQEALSLILHCKTTYCYRTTSLSTSTT